MSLNKEKEELIVQELKTRLPTCETEEEIQMVLNEIALQFSRTIEDIYQAYEQYNATMDEYDQWEQYWEQYDEDENENRTSRHEWL